MHTESTNKLHHGHQEQRQFLRTLSHDLGASFLLLESCFGRLNRSLDRGVASGLAAHVAHVDVCLQQMKQLLDDLARLARMGSVDLEPSRIDLSAIVEEVLAEQHGLLAGRGIDVTVRGPLGAVWCNAGRLKQVVTNLVRNAALHGCDAQQPRITIAPAAVDPDTMAGVAMPATAFQVHDNGPGIDPRLHRAIFLPGRRAAPRGADGLGMGLAIVDRLVARYGGKVYVDAHRRDGTAMVVVLPAAPEPILRGLPAGEHPDGRGRSLQVDHSHGECPGPLHDAVLPPSHAGLSPSV